MLWALYIHDGERQGPGEGDLDPDVRGQLNMFISFPVVQEGFYCKNVRVSTSGALSVIKDITPLNDKKSNRLTFKSCLLPAPN